MPKPERPEFTAAERRALALAGGDIPLTPTPFADMAAEAGLDEPVLLALLAGLKENGVVRRFGATLRHQKAGYGHNAMVAWRVPEADSEALGRAMAARPEISHCYRRRTYPEWPFNLYTMIHGKNPGDCLEVAAEIAADLGLDDYQVLRSIRELKKTSMRYF